jgi:hypothetical protein
MIGGLDLSVLDPGIRRVVEWLRVHGFDTTDSGDGRSKFDPDSPYYWPDAESSGVSRTPHVVIRTDPNKLVMVADALHELLRTHGVLANVDGEREAFFEAMVAGKELAEPPSIEASYNPGESIEGKPFGVVMLIGVDDARMFGA